MKEMITAHGFTPDGQSLSAIDLADKIGGFAKIRLCVDPRGKPGFQDWLVHERDRRLITKALRFFHAHGESEHRLPDGE